MCDKSERERETVRQKEREKQREREIPTDQNLSIRSKQYLTITQVLNQRWQIERPNQ